MPRWAARPQAVPPPDSGPMPPTLITSWAAAAPANPITNAAPSAADRHLCMCRFPQNGPNDGGWSGWVDCRHQLGRRVARPSSEPGSRRDLSPATVAPPPMTPVPPSPGPLVPSDAVAAILVTPDQNFLLQHRDD